MLRLSYAILCFFFGYYVPRCLRSLRQFCLCLVSSIFCNFLFMHIISVSYIQHHLMASNVLLIFLMLTLNRRGVWRNIWRDSMLRSIGCLTSLVEHLYVCLKLVIWCSITYQILAHLCSFVFFCWAGTQAFIWSPQSQGVLAFDPHPQEQVEVCSDLPWSHFNLDAATCYGWWKGQDG